MQNILLISNKVFHYRVEIYNYFYSKFKEYNYNLVVLTSELQESYDHQFRFKCIVQKPSFNSYKNEIEKLNPVSTILFLHLKDWIMWPLIHWLKLRKVPIIYWNHGVNLQDPNNRFKNLLFSYLHTIADAIILYSPAEQKYISERNTHKVFIGFNTLNFHSFPQIKESKETLKKELKIDFKKIVIFAARIKKERRLDLLIDFFKENTDNNIGLLLVGSGLSKEDQELIEMMPNVKYFGPVHDQLLFNKLIKLSDIFTIPGKSGLAINQAFYWSIPFITTNVRQSPEIWYVENGYNGVIADIDSENDYKNKLHMLLENDELREQMAINAKATAVEKADIAYMFKGFLEAIEFTLLDKSIK